MYEVTNISHTADICLKIVANTLPDLFLAALRSMGSILKDDFCQSDNQENISRYIEITAPDITVLLVDFLSEVLTLSHAEGVIFCQAKIIDLDHSHIKSYVYGQKVDAFDEDIKAVTYHEAEVQLNKKRMWQTLLILDI